MKVLMISLMLLAGCAQTPPVVTITPPTAYLQLPPAVTIPDGDVNNLQLAKYLYDLHDSDKLCRGQIAEIKKWLDEQKKELKK